MILARLDVADPSPFFLDCNDLKIGKAIVSGLDQIPGNNARVILGNAGLSKQIRV